MNEITITEGMRVGKGNNIMTLCILTDYFFITIHGRLLRALTKNILDRQQAEFIVNCLLNMF